MKPWRFLSSKVIISLGMKLLTITSLNNAPSLLIPITESLFCQSKSLITLFIRSALAFSYFQIKRSYGGE